MLLTMLRNFPFLYFTILTILDILKLLGAVVFVSELELERISAL